MFGLNKFGEPNYRIAWAQSEFQKMSFSRPGSGGGETTGYELTYKAGGTPSWLILRWKDPSNYGSPELFYENTYLDNMDLYFLGEYPWKGRYEVLYNLCSKEFVNGKLVIEHIELSHSLIDKIIPLLIESQYLSNFERQAARKMAKEFEHKKMVNEITDRMMNDLPAWYGPVSYAHQGCRTALLDQMMAKIQKKWNQLSRRGGMPVFTKGIQQANRPIISGRVS